MRKLHEIAASGTYRVKLTLPNPEKKITAGSKGTIQFDLKAAEK